MDIYMLFYFIFLVKKFETKILHIHVVERINWQILQNYQKIGKKKNPASIHVTISEMM